MGDRERMANETVNLRLIVMEMLMTVTEQKAENRQYHGGMYSHIVVRDTLNQYNYLSGQQKSFIKRLFEGTLERMIEIDFVINAYSKVKTEKMKPVIRAIMRLSVYQIFYMDSVPDAAACNEAVKLAQKKGFSTLKGFVNGVLRTIVKNKENIEYPSLSVKYSMPEWIVKLWTSQLGEEKTLDVLEGLLSEHPVTVRFRKASVIEEVKKALEDRGGSMEEHPYLEDAYKILKTDDITRLPHYDDGGFVIQDASSMLAVRSVFAGELLSKLRASGSSVRIVDICAAPGGKSMLITDLMRDTGIDYTIEARDVSEKKVRLMQENFARCGFDEKKVSAVVRDATLYDACEKETADIIIADVPCSGLGVIGKKRDIKYKIAREQIGDIVSLQRRILKAAVEMLKPNGRLLFSTCTINRAENEENFEWLKDELKMTPVSLNDALPKCIHSETTKDGYLQLLPKLHDTDGFFISVLKKQGGV